MTQEEINFAFENRWRMKHYIPENINGTYAKEIARDFFETGILIGEKSTVPEASPSSKNTIHTRAESFYLKVFEYAKQYPEQMLNDFYEYWTEPNPSNTKMRFELQRTWDLNRRLARWARNNFNRYGNTKPTLDEQRREKLADILAG